MQQLLTPCSAHPTTPHATPPPQMLRLILVAIAMMLTADTGLRGLATHWYRLISCAVEVLCASMRVRDAAVAASRAFGRIG